MNHPNLPSKTSTRLLSLEPGAATAPIRGSLVVIDLAQPHHDYEAVSYCWGLKGAEHPIKVNGLRMQIWANLFQCLLRLRLPTQERLLWIDAISISQTDLTEKSQQVQIISHIFRKATRVLAWLGEHANDSEQLFQPSPDFLIKSTLYDHVKHSLGLSNDQNHQQLLRRAKQWCHLFSRPYFSRTWIVQEIALARSILVHCGGDSMGWAELIGQRMKQRQDYFDGLAVNTTMLPGMYQAFSKVPVEDDIRRLKRLRDALRSLFAIMQPIRILQDIVTGEYREMVDGNYRPFDYNIFGIMELFRYTACREPMDRIYAIQSLERRQAGSQPIPVNYAAGMPSLIVTLYEHRYVLQSSSLFAKKRGLFQEEGFEAVQKAQSLIYAMRLDRDLCQRILDAMTQRIRNEDDKELKSRWNKVFETFRDAANKVADLASWDNDTRDGRGLPVLGLDGEKYRWV